MAAEEFKISLGVDLNDASLGELKSKIETIKVNPIKLNIDTSNVQSQINSIKTQIQNLGKIKINLTGGSSGGSGLSHTVTDVNNAYKDLMNLQRRISSLRIQLGGLDSSKNSNQISELSGQLNRLMTDYNNLYQTFNRQFSTDQLDSLNRGFETATGKIQALNSKMSDMQATLRDKIKFDLNTGTLGNQVDTIEQKLNKLGVTNQSVSDKVNQLKTLLGNMDATDDIESVTSDYEKYKQVLAEVTNQVNTLQREQAELQRKQATELAKTQLANAKTAFSSQIDVWLSNNSAAAKQFGSQIQALKSQIQSADGVTLNNLKAQFKEITQQAKLAGDTGLTFGDKLKAQFSKLGIYFSATMIIMQTVNAIKTGINTVVELDNALVDLQKTAKTSASELNNFYFEANNIAKQYGATTKEIIQSAADWSRLGYTLDESKIMSQYSSMFKSISPGMDIDTATSGLVSVMKAYGIEVEDVMDGIMSKINAVGNSAAESNTDIVTGLQNSAAAMAAMGSTLDETIAIFTAAQEITQDSSKVGNALRSISMRIRGYDEETEQLSADLANITGDVIDLTKTASNPDGISLFTDATQTEYKSIYTYLQEISKIYDEIGAKEKQELMEKLFGKNRASVGAAILSNFSAAEKAMDTMANSAGSAEKEMDVITQSLTYKLNALKETSVGVAQNLFTRSDMGHVIDGLTSIMNVLDFVTDKLGLFKTAALGITAALSFKNIGRDKMFSLFLNMPITMCVLPDMAVSI